MDLKSFKEILKLDNDTMSHNVIPATLKVIKELGQSYMEKYLRNYVKTNLELFLNKYDLIVYSLYI